MAVFADTPLTSKFLCHSDVNHSSYIVVSFVSSVFVTIGFKKECRFLAVQSPPGQLLHAVCLGQDTSPTLPRLNVYDCSMFEVVVGGLVGA